MKKRLDVLLVERGLQESRQKAQATIMSGLVFVKGQRADKPGAAVDEAAEIEIRGNTPRWYRSSPPCAAKTSSSTR